MGASITPTSAVLIMLTFIDVIDSACATASLTTLRFWFGVSMSAGTQDAVQAEKCRIFGRARRRNTRKGSALLRLQLSAEQFQPVVDKFIPHLLRNLHFQGFELSVIELNHFTRLHIHEMLVVFT